MKHSLWILILLAAWACQPNKPATTNNDDQNEVPDDTETIDPDFKQAFDAGDYIISVTAKNAEISDIAVQSKGLKYEYDEQFNVEGQLKGAFLLDLNNDSYNELYMVIDLNDDMGLKKIIAIASNNNLSMSEAAVEELDVLMVAHTDNIFSEKGKLMRKFEVSGKGEVRYQYEITPGEASYMVRPVLVD